MKKMIVIGNIGKTPEIRNYVDGKEYICFSLAVTGAKKDVTEWIEVYCVGKLIDVVKNYTKIGTKIYVEGFPNVKAYLTKDNQPKASITLNATNMEILSSKIQTDHIPF